MNRPKKIKLVRRTLVAPLDLVPPDGLGSRELLIWKRNQAIYTTFDELYEVQRLRIDDVVIALEGTFFLSERAIREILADRPTRTKHPAPAQERMPL
jgi:hypothetical protein